MQSKRVFFVAHLAKILQWKPEKTTKDRFGFGLRCFLFRFTVFRVEGQGFGSLTSELLGGSSHDL